MATGIRRVRKEDMKGFEIEGVPSTIKEVKSKNFSGTKFVSRDFGSSRVSNETKGQHKTEDGDQVSVSEVSSVSFRRRLWRTSIAPIQRIRITKESPGQFFVFLLRVAALETIRRVSRNRCPQIWWGLQGISLLQAPPFSWFQRWAPLRHLVEGTQSFSKPLIFLSLATAISSAADEFQQASEPNLLGRVLAPSEDSLDGQAVMTEEQQSERKRRQKLNRLKQALLQADVSLPDRIGDEELENFFVAESGNVPKFVEKVKKSVSWRQTYHFFNSDERSKWSHFVSWHGFDAKARPALIIRIGPAYTKLPAEQRPRFCQAVVSQVEYGIINLLNEDDPRITVIMDCAGTRAIGFPIHMMKSCAVLVQENYPTRLAALFAINLPPVVRVVANGVMQVVSPVTRKKVSLLGDVSLTALSEHVGGTDKVAISLGGTCHCPRCMEERKSAMVDHVSSDRSLIGYSQVRSEEDLREDESTQGLYDEDLVTDYQSYNAVLRIAIVGILMLWIMIAVVAGLHEPDFPPT